MRRLCMGEKKSAPGWPSINLGKRPRVTNFKIGAITSSQNDIEVEEYLKELNFLTNTAGGHVLKIFKLH